MKKWWITVAVVALVLAAATVQAKDWKKVRIGVEGAYPPFSYVTPEGELAGFDIDIAKALGAAMGVQVELVGPGLGRHHSGPAGQEVRRHHRLHVHHRRAQEKGGVYP